MKRFSEAADFGILISNAWPQSRRTQGATLDATRRVLEKFPFFARVQTVDIPFADERRAFRELVCQSGRAHTYTLTRVMAEKNLNLSALTAAERMRACKEISACFDAALEAGASVIGLVSGARPEEAQRRGDALRGLEESLSVLCDAARPLGLKIQIEPLDYEAHKRASLGTNAEAVSIAKRLDARGRDLRLCIDMAHLLLNAENDIAAAVDEARPFIEEFHVCNAVLDRAHPLFGDRHLPFGEPGVVGLEKITDTLRAFIRSGYLGGESRPAIACEVMTPDGADPIEHIARHSELMEQAWALACG